MGQARAGNPVLAQGLSCVDKQLVTGLDALQAIEKAIVRADEEQAALVEPGTGGVPHFACVEDGLVALNYQRQLCRHVARGPKVRRRREVQRGASFRVSGVAG